MKNMLVILAPTCIKYKMQKDPLTGIMLDEQKKQKSVGGQQPYIMVGF